MGIRSKVKRITVKHPRDYGEKIEVTSYGIDDIVADIKEFGRRLKAGGVGKPQIIRKNELVDALVDLTPVEFRQVIKCAKHNRYCLRKYVTAIKEKERLERI